MGITVTAATPPPTGSAPYPIQSVLRTRSGVGTVVTPAIPIGSLASHISGPGDRAPAAAATRVDRLGLKAELIVLQPEPF